ncbi:hypothetical protein EIN_310040 [Entamoeba invadens IP1]|uniref:Uncharacterized protein n=1 Tax=Entamoeba invadens IP1 TaxID=370355 RepID=A0A0A1TWF1_ENTIV|nr:hypothetical protein EIN_310040 [Entamoeba invadens IP1]ELP84971.1 hypothetical protein EIN_310040 [Entamoeba invadens IP1]|eukprot:XP_004184317.1 hypothetical protein EIN_310040 [Entamoeba invadens IP1]
MQNLKIFKIKSNFVSLDLSKCLHLLEVVIENISCAGKITFPYFKGTLSIQGNGDGLSVSGCGSDTTIKGVVSYLKLPLQPLLSLLIDTESVITVEPNSYFEDTKRNRRVAHIETTVLIINSNISLEYIGIPMYSKQVICEPNTIKGIYITDTHNFFFFSSNTNYYGYTEMWFSDDNLRNKTLTDTQSFESDKVLRKRVMKKIDDWKYLTSAHIHTMHWACIHNKDVDIYAEEHTSHTKKTWELVSKVLLINKMFKNVQKDGSPLPRLNKNKRYTISKVCSDDYDDKYSNVEDEDDCDEIGDDLQKYIFTECN